MKIIKKLSVTAFVVTLGISLLVSCAKKDVDPAVSQQDSPELNLDPDGVYYMGADGSLQKVDLETMQQNPELTYKNGNGNSHVNAHYSFQFNPVSFYKATTVQINATANSQGVIGEGHWWRTWGDDGEFTYHVIMDADCLESDGESAVFIGIVTSILGPTTGFPSVGSRVWIRVKDNGQGPNSPSDQYAPLILFNPGGSIPCEIFGLNSPIWTLVPLEEVANSSDYVNVN